MRKIIFLFSSLLMISPVMANEKQAREIEIREVRYRKRLKTSIKVPFVYKLKVSPSVEVRYQLKQKDSGRR